MDNASLIDAWVSDQTLPAEDIVKRITVDRLWSSYKRNENQSHLSLQDIKEYAHKRKLLLDRSKPWPITTAARKIRVEIETEQRLLASIKCAENLNEVAKLMPGYESLQNIATLLAANARAHIQDPEFANSIDPLLSVMY